MEDDRRRQRRNDDLEGEDRGRHARGGAALERAGVEQQAEDGRAGDEQRPAERVQRLATVDRVAEQLGGQCRQRERRARGDHDRPGARARTGAEAPGHDRDQRDRPQHDRDAPHRDVRVDRVAARRRGERQHRDPGDHGAGGEPLAPRDRLAQRAAREREQQHRADAERRLHDRQRCEREGRDLKRPADRAEREAREPAWPAQKTPEQHGVQALGGVLRARLARLHERRAVEARGRRKRGEDPEEEVEAAHGRALRP
jgi:hypothetical protein